MKKQNGDIKPRATLGLILIVLAVLLFLNNIGIRVLSTVLGHWPLIALALGAYLLVGQRERPASQRGVGPFVLLAVGAVGLLTRYGFWHFNTATLIGPVVLLVVGLYLFRPDRFNRKPDRPSAPRLPANDDQGRSEAAESAPEDADQAAKSDTSDLLNDNKIDVFTLLGGSQYVSRSQKLKGGNVLCVLGGAELDLREADTEDQVLTIDVLAFMGGAEIRIPAHWQVTVKAFSLLGGISNRTTCLADKMGVPSKHLVITGFAIMGGIELKN